MLDQLLKWIMMISVLASWVPFGQSGESAYMALLPARMVSGERQAVSLSLWKGSKPASGKVDVSLWQDGARIAGQESLISGKGTVEFQVPSHPGQYEVKVSGPGFSDETTVEVVEGALIFLETDKPIYKPGQAIKARIITLDSELRATTSTVTVEVLDAKGIKVARETLESDEFGMSDFTLPLSSEPNLGTWKLTASTGESEVSLDVKVEKYVLPKYEVSVDLPRDWFLPDESIEGRVAAEYSFGKPVTGELIVTARRYVGEWEEFATFQADIDGEAPFEIPPAEYVAGVPAARGMGNVQLEVSVLESGTGYEEKTTRLLTIAPAELSLQLIPEGSTFKPGLPFSFLLVTETPDNELVDAPVLVDITYTTEKFERKVEETRRIETEGGKTLLELVPPKGCIAMEVSARAEEAYAVKTLRAGYSPSDNFIHVEQLSEGPLEVGDRVEFEVHSTREAANFYYEVLSRGRVVFTDFTRSDTVSFQTTPLMAPSSRLLVYQVLPNSEVAADYLPFQVGGDYPHQLSASFSQEEVAPGGELNLEIEAEGKSRVGLGVVDRSVYILAEKRLNLAQVFEELERLYMEPQAELHEIQFSPVIYTPGARDTFQEAGVVVLTNRNLPAGSEAHRPEGELLLRAPAMLFGAVVEQDAAREVVAEAEKMVQPTSTSATGGELAEVTRVRQFFPETWLWDTLETGTDGEVSLPVVAPDTITTWQLRAVGISREKGLGISEDALRVFQPFFLKVDLPYSCVRGEEFPVRIALYNYLEEPQEIHVEIEGADWFDLLGDTDQAVVTVPAGDVVGVSFPIRAHGLGTRQVKVSARSTRTADAVLKDIIVEPEGVAREKVQNLVISAPSTTPFDTLVPAGIVPDSARAYLAVTASYLAQTIEGLDGLLAMPFGCGEQNMIMLAPDIFITRYLEESGQLKPEIMAKAEMLMTTGYQRELTFRRQDGSFSAFGEQDQEGSLWLTAFVLKTLSQAQDMLYIDPEVLNRAGTWITSHQHSNGSFEPVGFLHHEEMMGGVQGKTALTAYVTAALLETGEREASGSAIQYLESELRSIRDPYTMALVAYALELGGSAERDTAHDRLMDMAIEDVEGLHWGDREGGSESSVSIETTGYAILALLEHGDQLAASRGAQWLVGQRNAFGGFGSTQDTVVGLQALTAFAAGSRADVDLTVSVEGKGISEDLHIAPSNYDVLQLVSVPVDQELALTVQGEGQAVAQLVLRYNVPQAERSQQIFDIRVDYDTHQVEVNDHIDLEVSATFHPPVPVQAGMVVLDIAVPTGFLPVDESIVAAAEAEPRIKRYDIAARKVIFYIEDMEPGDEIEFEFQALASYPVKAKGVTSQAYSYYKPQWKGETLGQEIMVVD
jgi:CD109 antigen